MCQVLEQLIHTLPPAVPSHLALLLLLSLEPTDSKRCTGKTLRKVSVDKRHRFWTPFVDILSFLSLINKCLNTTSIMKQSIPPFAYQTDLMLTKSCNCFSVHALQRNATITTIISTLIRYQWVFQSRQSSTDSTLLSADSLLKGSLLQFCRQMALKGVLLFHYDNKSSF